MAEPVFDADAIIAALSPALGLVIDDAARPGVATFLRVAERMARIVEAAPVPDDDAELAPVFRPGRAGDAA
ncbi:MAG: hypothetical protein JWN07_99 [Hyphomicrobiales bacterium]|nr:hypothetical protein [Hyphomicrobiales bacterium]